MLLDGGRLERLATVTHTVSHDAWVFFGRVCHS